MGAGIGDNSISMDDLQGLSNSNSLSPVTTSLTNDPNSVIGPAPSAASLQALGDPNSLSGAMALNNQAVSPTVANSNNPAWAAAVPGIAQGLQKGLSSMSGTPQRGGGGGMMQTPQQTPLPAALTQGNNSFLQQALQQLNPNGQLNANLLYGG